MQIVESGNQLIGQLTGFVLGDRFLDLEQFVEITVGVFGDDADLLVRFERVEDLDDVFVGQILLNGVFLAEILDFVFAAAELFYVLFLI